MPIMMFLKESNVTSFAFISGCTLKNLMKIPSWVAIINTAKIKSVTKSAIRSTKTVPTNLVKGIFSYLDNILHLTTSPALGARRFIKYKIRTEKFHDIEIARNDVKLSVDTCDDFKK